MLILISGFVLVAGSGTGAADGPTTFSNTTAIAIPATGSANQIGPASPYPSTINVSGMNGLVTAVTVTMTGLTHSILNDIDAMLVAPDGKNLTVLSDASNPNTFTFANNANLTFSDSGAALPGSGNVASGTYLPTGQNGADSFPSPAPAQSSQTTFAGAFSGISANGDWKLFIVDDATGDIGSMSGGWSLTITTAVSSVATTTTVATSGSPSATGSPVTFTATVKAGATAVTSGTVQFRDGTTAIGAPVALNGSGTASVTTGTLAEGTHSITATYSGASGFLTSNGSVTQQVDNATTVTGGTFCNTGVITTPDKGTATPYPSHITVSGIAGTPSAVTVDLKGVSHSAPIDFDILLSAPDPTRNIVLLSDAGGQNPVSGVNLTFSDTAAGAVASPLSSGTFTPTNLVSDVADSWPAPAPAPTAATTFVPTLTEGTINGQWSLYVVDDATGDTGSIGGGWCVTVRSPSPTVTALTSSDNPSTDGSPVTLTATVTSGGSPVSVGTVTFADGGTQLGGPVTVSGTGVATLTTPFAAGSHPITATYSRTVDFATSSGTLTQNTDPVVDAGGPYTVAEGESLTLSGSGTTGSTVAWDLNDDGDFTDTTGSSPTLSWGDLQALGIDDGPGSYPVTVRATLGGRTATDAATLTVTNTAPDAVLTGGRAATAGQPFTIKVGADDPSAADMAATFTYMIDWGDGSPAETVTGPADPPVTHTYDTAGTVDASFTATDKDGDTGGPNEVQIVVGEAPPTTTTTPTSETSTSETSTSETSTSETSTSETSTSETSTSETSTSETSTSETSTSETSTSETSTSETSTSETSTSETSTSETSTSQTATGETSTSETSGETSTSETSSETSTSETSTSPADPDITATSGRTVSGVIIVVRPATTTEPATTYPASTGSSSESLAYTGVDVDRPLLVGIAMLAAGAAMIAATRTRRRGRHQ